MTINAYACSGVPAMGSGVSFEYTNMTFCDGTACHVDAVRKLAVAPEFETER